MSHTTRNIRLPWYRSIQGRLTIVSLLLALAPVSLVTALVFFQARDSLRQQIGGSVQSVAEAVGRDIERFLTERRGNIEIIARSTIFTSRTSSAQDKTAFLGDFQATYQGYASLYFTDAQGSIVSATDHTLGDQSARDWFKNAVAKNGAVVSDVYYLTSAQRIVVTISSPVYAADGSLLGVVAGNIDGQNFSDVAAATHVGETGKVFFVNRAGRVVIDPVLSAVFTDVSASEAVKAALRGERGTLLGPTEQGVVAFQSYVPLAGAEDWAVVGELPISELDAPILGLAQRIAILAALVGVAVVLIVIVVATRIVRPIRQLTDSAQRLQNDLTVRSDVRSGDEIGQLALSFNEMADTIQKREQDLRQQTDELRIATAEAREASRLKDEFLAVMSHELRTPLNAIIGFTGILTLTKNLEPNVEHKIRRIRANGERLLALINDILDISRIESGRMQLTFTPIAIRPLIETLDAQMIVLAEEKGLAFKVHIDEAVPQLIEIDQDAITKIATNLLSNAFKFTEKGEVNLNLHWQEKDSQLVIEVIDTGIGIPAHMSEIIFETFRQVDGSSTRKYGGSGLGLSIVRHLCSTMNGTVQVSSVVDGGSTFTVTLPVHVPAQVGGIAA